MVVSTTPTTATPPAQQYDYQAELTQITNKIENNLKAKLETALSQMDKQFAQKLQQIKHKVEEKIQRLDPITTAQTKLQTTQENQARDLKQITKNMNYLMAQVANIADRLKNFTNAFTSPTLSNSAGQS